MSPRLAPEVVSFDGWTKAHADRLVDAASPCGEPISCDFSTVCDDESLHIVVEHGRLLRFHPEAGAPDTASLLVGRPGADAFLARLDAGPSSSRWSWPTAEGAMTVALPPMWMGPLAGPIGRPVPGLDFVVRVELTDGPLGTHSIVLTFRDGQLVAVTDADPAMRLAAAVEVSAPFDLVCEVLVGEREGFDLTEAGAVLDGDAPYVLFFVGFVLLPDHADAFRRLAAGPWRTLAAWSRFARLTDLRARLAELSRIVAVSA